MPTNECAQAALMGAAWMVAEGHAIKLAICQHDLGMPTGVADVVHLDAGGM
jgi:hypothetical protein